MATSPTSLARFDALVRPACTVTAALIAIITWFTRGGTALDIALLFPTVLAFVAWVAVARLSAWIPFGFATVTPFVLNIVDVYDEVAMMFLVLTVTYVTLFVANRAFAWAYGFSVAALILVFSWTGVFDDLGWENWVFGLAFSGIFGQVGHRLRSTITELEATRTAMVEQAAVHERRRIARDVHDLVGHSLSVVMLHLTGARHVLRSDPDEAERALEHAENAGRESLTEIRRTIGLLRDPDETGSAPATPGLSDIADLVQEFRTTGAAIELASTGPLESIGDAVGLASYRIVQEALTNATRHAAGAAIDVSVRVDNDRCDLRVQNGAGRSASPAPTTPGYGLVGMRERARSVGGSLTAAPAGSGWLVEASLPTNAVAGERP